TRKGWTRFLTRLRNIPGNSGGGAGNRIRGPGGIRGSFSCQPPNGATGECTRIAATSDSWMHVWMHVKFHRKHRGTEGVPVEVGVLVHNVALAVVGDPLQHILRRATAPAERDEGVSRRMERPGTDPSRLSVADERLVETRPGV